MEQAKYEVTKGTITLVGNEVCEIEVDERQQAGLFLAMQYPSVISGVTNADFLRTAINTRREEADEISFMKFIRHMDENMMFRKMNSEMEPR